MASVLKRESVDFDSATESAGSRGMHSGKGAQIVWLDGRAVAIEFTCTCGERSLIELEYDEKTQAGAPRPNSKTEPKN